MKRFKKIITVIIIALLLVASTFLINGVYGYSNTDRNKIIGYNHNGGSDSDKKLNVEYTLADNMIVEVLQVEEGVASNGQVSILHQPNVWCVQKGAEIIHAKYKVSESYTVEDPVLAYIIANGPQMGTLESDWSGGSQVALWLYLSDKGITNADKERILKNISASSVEVGGIVDDNDYKEGVALYEEAKEYASNLDNSEITMSDIDIEENKATFTVNGDYDNLKVYLNGKETSYTISNNTVTVDISNVESSTISITAEASIKKYSASYRILYAHENLDNSVPVLQRLLVATGVTEDDSKTTTAQKEKDLNTEVSLQKYITKVNETELKDLPDETTTLKDRKNQMTEKTDETILDEIFGRTVKDNISGAPAEVNAVDPDNKKYKRGETDEDENAVRIDINDTVTYMIEVYNNSTVPASKVYLRDQLPDGAELVEVKRDGTVLTAEEWKENSFGTMDSVGDFVDLVVGNKYYEYTIENLASGQKTCFEVTVKFNEYSEETLINTAWINKTEPENITDNYRIEDKDYVKMKNPFKVSLEKYISAVNGIAPTGDDAGREGKAEYLTEKDGKYVNETENDTEWTQHNTYKKDHIVTVSKGDIVTYTIKVTNDGKSQVYISEITDWFPNGVKYGKNEYNGDGEGKLDTNKVIFTNLSGELLEPGESASFTVDVEVIEENDSTKVLKNTAKITKIKDTKGNELVADDHDTTPFDNEDSDYIDLNYVTPPPVEETTSYFVEKIWADNNNRKGLRPDKITVELHRLGEGKLEEIELSGSGNVWKYEWKDLAKYDNDGNEYQYFVKEKSQVPNYTTTYPTDTPSNTTKIKNTYYEVDPPADPEKTSYSVEKFWISDSVTTRHSKIEVQLYKNGNPEGSVVEISPNSEGRWVHTWNDLDKSYVYTVKELNIPTGYTVSYTEGHSGCSIYNTYNTTQPDPDDPITPDIPVMDYSVISGFVWNDIAQDKLQNNYDGIYQTSGGGNVEKETPIEGIKVMLYRVGEGKILEDYTDANGKYSFNDADLATNMLLVNEIAGKDGRYIKGPKHCYRDPDTGELVTTTWTGEYYSYYIIFEYDGVTYTTTDDMYKPFTSSINIDSNAKENNNLLELAIIVKSREDFNNNFGTINNGSGINYDTVNENGYIPQSRHNAYTTDLLGNKILLDKYKMQSSTDLINMGAATEEQLDHVNLGLRGRAIFDLELTSDVVEIDVNINNQTGVYKNTNRVNLRNSDIKLYEDMANIEQEESNDYDAEQNQYIRESDKNALGEITVTYKITVFNASPTPGKATKITNYYDDSYEVLSVHSGGTELGYTSGSSGSGYNSIEITTPGTTLNQSEKMEIYVVYSLKNSAINEIGNLSVNGRFITYNMSEITEYKAECGSRQTECTRGLIDKDSAPGSANKEQVRTTDTEGPEDQNTPTTGGNPTTVKYYFDKKLDINKDDNQYLAKLKYEDDTYATPLVYTISDSSRTITGTVFEDSTTVDSGTKIKTGNGKLDDGEVGIHGATVELIEQGGSNSHYVKDTNENGEFSFSGFLPGNYIIKYSYGDTEKTVLLSQYNEDGDNTTYTDKELKTNKESYNGEDYQSTNNTGTHGAFTLNNLSNFWYVINESEGISTATDDSNRRTQVSGNVLSFEPSDIQKLNSIRDLIGTYNSDSNNGTLTSNKKWNAEKNVIIDIEGTTITGIKDIIDKTSMFATTKSMLITVEETDELNGLTDSNELLEKELIVEKLDEHGNKTGLVEWCIFPGSSDYYTEYKIENMNFGIAKVPVTTVDLDKYISGFTITDSTGNNVISSLSLVTNADGTTSWKLTGDSLYLPAGEVENAETKYDVSIEDEKLQGARLEITYTISQEIHKEVNFNGDTVTSSATIKGIVDFVDNNLSYNPELGNNAVYWDIITYEDLVTKRNKLVEIYTSLGKTVTEADIEIPAETEHTTILELKESSGFYNLAEGTNYATITLEKVLSSTNSTIDSLLSEVLDDSGYSNTIRITGWEYSDVTDGIDRIRTEEGYIILPGLDHDYSKSEILVIHPPTGSNFNILYLAIAVISLAILAAGVFGIKKFVIKK